MQATRGTPLSQHGVPLASASSGRSSFRIRVLFVLIAAAAYAVDQVTKKVAVEQLADEGRVDLIGDLLGLRLTFNSGAAFSLGSDYTQVFTALAVVATGTVLYLAPRLGSRMWAVALGLLLAGITGNLTDRLLRPPGPLRGEVVDFLQLPNWPIFNVADMCLNIAMVLILVQSFRGIRLDGGRHESGR